MTGPIFRLSILATILTACVLPFAAGPCQASEPKDPVSTLRYLTGEYCPYNYTEDGQAKGIAVEILKLIWNELDIEEQPLEFLPWARAYEILLATPGTVLFATIKTLERTPLFQWVGPINKTRTLLIARADSPITMITINDLQGYTVGTIHGYASESTLRNLKLDFQIHSTRSIKTSIKKLVSGRIDMISLEEQVFRYTIDEMELPRDSFKTVWVLDRSEIYFAFNKKTPASLIDRFQKALDVVRHSTKYQDILFRYQR